MFGLFVSGGLSRQLTSFIVKDTDCFPTAGNYTAQWTYRGFPAGFTLELSANTNFVDNWVVLSTSPITDLSVAGSVNALPGFLDLDNTSFRFRALFGGDEMPGSGDIPTGTKPCL